MTKCQAVIEKLVAHRHTSKKMDKKTFGFVQLSKDIPDHFIHLIQIQYHGHAYLYGMEYILLTMYVYKKTNDIS